jgi:hypothetical protein
MIMVLANKPASIYDIFRISEHVHRNPDVLAEERLHHMGTPICGGSIS